MISRFRFRAPAARFRPAAPCQEGAGPRWSGGTGPQGPGGSPDPKGPPGSGGAEPLAGLLISLRGHQVTLQIGERLVTGKLIAADPITLVGPAGEVTIVAPGVVKSVQF